MAKESFRIAEKNYVRIFRATIHGDQNTVFSELRVCKLDANVWINGKSLLHHAGDSGNTGIARLLIQFGADPNQVYGKQQRSLLHFAAATFRYGFASVLLNNGANPNPRTTSNSTPLHFAARSGQEYLAVLLCEHGADTKAKDHLGRTPQDLANTKGYANLAQKLNSVDDQVASVVQLNLEGCK